MRYTLLKTTTLLLVTLGSSLWATAITSEVPNTNLEVGEPFEYWVKSDASRSDKIRFKLQNSREGMRIHAKSGLITWTPTSNQANQDFISTVILELNNKQVSTQKLHFHINSGSNELEDEALFVRLSNDKSSLENGSTSAPFSSLRDACIEASTKDGIDKIFVRGGYNKGLINANKLWDCNGTKTTPLIVTPWGNEQVTIAFNGRSGLSIRNSEHLVVKGFEIIGANSKINFEKTMEKWWEDDDILQGTGIYIGENSHDIVIEKNLVHDTTAAGIKAVKASSVKIKNNIVYNCAWWTIQGTTGIGITLAQPHDGDTNDKAYYNQITGNLLFANESRIYSRVWKKYGAVFHVDEGEAILIQEENVGETGDYNGRYLIKNNFMLYNGKTAVINKADHVTIKNNSYYMNGTTTMSDNNYTAGGLRVNNSSDVLFVKNAIDADVEHGLIYSVSDDKAISAMRSNYARGAVTHYKEEQEIPKGIIRVSNDVDIFQDPENGDFNLIVDKKDRDKNRDIGADIDIMEEHLTILKRYAIKMKPTGYKVNHKEMTRKVLLNIPDGATIDKSHFVYISNEKKKELRELGKPIPKVYLTIRNIPLSSAYTKATKHRDFKIYLKYDENLFPLKK